MEADFSGYATKVGLKCTDGRVIHNGAFKDNDGGRVPLVWQHRHNEPINVLGHALLENREDGVYAYGFFNDTEYAQHAKTSVKNGDIKALSIYANELVQRGPNVVHGAIREVSLVLSGANPGAFIDNINLKHGDSIETLDDEAIIYTGLELEHADNDTSKEEETNVAENNTDTSSDDKTVKDVFDAMTEEQKNVVYFMIGQAIEGNDSDSDEDDELEQSDNTEALIHSINDTIQEGFSTMSRNVFDQSDAGTPGKNSLSHAQVEAIVNDAKKVGSFKEAFLAHAETYGFEPIDTLFPDAKTLSNQPEMIARRSEWVAEVIGKTKHSPFTRIKTVVADITADEARARGYVKGNLKKEEIVKLLKRKTEPTTIYKKQKLDRDDILDITDLDVVAWLKAEMRLMLDEEVARAILLGDGRDAADEDKIDEDRIRPIVNDDPMYAHPVTLASNTGVDDTIEALIRGRAQYRGTGQPVFFTTLPFLTDMLLHKDKMGRRIYDGVDALASALMVSKIVPVEVMEQHEDVVGIFVNLSDYTVGADKGGQVSMFDDFDIDYNQHKYLTETRISGALTKPKSAVVVKRTAGTAATPVSPSFDGETNTITIPSVTGVVYQIEGIPVSGSETISSDTDVEAVADEGYYIPAGSTTHWNFAYNAG